MVEIKVDNKYVFIFINKVWIVNLGIEKDCFICVNIISIFLLRLWGSRYFYNCLEVLYVSVIFLQGSLGKNLFKCIGLDLVSFFIGFILWK